MKFLNSKSCCVIKYFFRIWIQANSRFEKGHLFRPLFQAISWTKDQIGALRTKFFEQSKMPLCTMSCGLELWLCQDFPTPVARVGSGHPNWMSIVNRGHEHFHSTKVREILLWLLFYCYTSRGNLLVLGFVWPHKLVPLKPAKLPRCTQSTQASHYFPKDSAISLIT